LLASRSRYDASRNSNKKVMQEKILKLIDEAIAEERATLKIMGMGLG